MKKTQLLCIDPQVDFCVPGQPMFVTGADEDSKRLASLIHRSLDLFDDIRVTLDSHQPVHVAHAMCWVDQAGNHPPDFTIISVDDVVGNNPKWKAANPTWQNRQVEYVKALAAGGRYVLCIWPIHCQISTVGATVTPVIGEALRAWQDQFAMIDFVTKGSNPFTEHYSVVRADVVDPTDPTTDINMSFIRRIQEADEILVGGQALSHCVANSVRDIAAEFGDEHIKKIVLLEDACSSVPGFQSMADDFLKEMIPRGMRVAKTTDF